MALDNKQEKLETAQKRVEELKGFYDHLIVFLLIHLIILGAVLYFNADLMFFLIFTLLGWGLGLLVHALMVFNWNPITSKEWEQRKIQEFLTKEENVSNE